MAIGEDSQQLDERAAYVQVPNVSACTQLMDAQIMESLELQLRLAVWDGDADAVRALLQEWPDLVAAGRISRTNGERFNSREALGLAIRLQRLEIVHCLLEAGADILAIDCDGWRLEAHVPRAFPDVDALLAQAAEAAGLQKLADWKERAVGLADRLQNIPDCDVELHWTFSTWLPVIGRLLPQDTVHLRKSGPRLRVDYTLKSIAGLNWEHGNCTLIARIDEDGSVFYVDHDAQKVHTLERKLLKAHSTQQERAKKQRRRALKRGYLDVGKVRLQETGKIAVCGAFQKCKIYQLEGLEYTTLVLPRLQGTRVEDGKSSGSKWRNIMKFAKGFQGQRDYSLQTSCANPDILEFQATFPNCELANHSPTAEALPRPAISQVRQINGHVLMSSEFPLSRDQFVTIAESLSASDERYLTIKDFFDMKLPEGFPVKFTIPVVPTLSATISFTQARLCAHDPEIFELPSDYQEVEALDADTFAMTRTCTTVTSVTESITASSSTSRNGEVAREPRLQATPRVSVDSEHSAEFYSSCQLMSSVKACSSREYGA